jgi:hypothetical protein
MQVPFEPTAFPSAGRVHVTYELHLRNFAPNPVTLQRVEILDADTAGATPVAVLESDALEHMLQPVGVRPPAGATGDPIFVRIRSGNSFNNARKSSCIVCVVI